MAETRVAEIRARLEAATRDDDNELILAATRADHELVKHAEADIAYLLEWVEKLEASRAASEQVSEEYAEACAEWRERAERAEAHTARLEQVREASVKVRKKLREPCTPNDRAGARLILDVALHALDATPEEAP